MSLFEYLPNYLNESEAQELFKFCMTDLPWTNRSIKIFGKEHEVPRRECFFNSSPFNYSYSGQQVLNQSFPKKIHDLLERIQRDFDVSLNCCLANLYRDGDDSNGWHADDEKSLGPEPVIVSISLGAAREFQWREKQKHASIQRQILENGSLFIMKAGFQESYKHCMPKRKRVNAPRVNLTFRKLVQNS